jgi:hypothetical protein
MDGTEQKYRQALEAIARRLDSRHIGGPGNLSLNQSALIIGTCFDIALDALREGK